MGDNELMQAFAPNQKAADNSAGSAWDHFISQEQVLRRGIIMHSSETFTRDMSIALSESIRAEADKLAGSCDGTGWLGESVSGFRQTSEARIHANRKIIVDLPSFSFSVGGRAYDLGATCTVCEGESHSKLWSRLTFYPEAEDECNRLIEASLTRAFELYTAQAKVVAPEAELEPMHKLNIHGAYSTDNGLIDIYNILLRFPDPEAAIDEVIDSQKESAIGRLFWFAKQGYEFKSDNDKLRQIWLANNSGSVEDGKMSTVVPLTVNQNDSLFLVRNDETDDLEIGETHAWGLCFSDVQSPFEEVPDPRRAAAQVTGKLASLLAADI